MEPAGCEGEDKQQLRKISNKVSTTESEEDKRPRGKRGKEKKKAHDEWMKGKLMLNSGSYNYCGSD